MVKRILNYFIGYSDPKKNRPLCIFLSKTSLYRRNFVKPKCFFISIKDEKLLKRYNKIWKKASNIVCKEFDSKSLYNKKYLKIKIKSYNGKIITIIKSQKKTLNAFVYQ